ncbi:MAG TPA: type II toxin-antitoxin system RelE/ParE family toxin [Candidatus Binataceae bacterium]|nr:type II toxin-antitoxin system RelE/ParE family toxin [Candidatus Binataceae bacterium]
MSSVLTRLFETGRGAKVDAKLIQRCNDRLQFLDAARDLRDVNLPGYNLHPLHTSPVRPSIHINGPGCVTFEWQAPNAVKVDLEQYH